MATPIGVHETLELHELLMFKNVCATKSATMSTLAQDDELKRILNEDVNKSRHHIEQLQNILS
ncbi:spore coat protein [Bacillus canaveralius]|uniref:Spore coat protein n=1 Tax=Bacillus canaveralius TaxID=1403243 RepID=A0A2N5GP85_9BACI|nr:MULTISPECIES: spore coat protein [Bacillus]PLR84385.1 spore coat protein [Bacillus canaveralius]PLR87032.1 spore coat protein [Bacillus sp. V33-4]PLS00613.1 spore coat protein [Bacillus canaveralius]RSK57900.1 spore coat protein [Bacillus canaveralius]